MTDPANLKRTPGGATLRRKGKDPEPFDLKSTNDELYGIEADAVAEFFDKGECPYVTVQDTIDNMRALDALRKSVGLKFATEAVE